MKKTSKNKEQGCFGRMIGSMCRLVAGEVLVAGDVWMNFITLALSVIFEIVKKM